MLPQFHMGAIANGMLFCERMVASINEMRNVFPVPPGTSKKYSPPLSSFIALIIVL
jgi:hypothetical protein